MSERRRVATATATATLALAVLLGMRPFSTERIVAGYLIVLAAIAAASLTRTLADAGGERTTSLLDAALAARPEPPMRPPDLVRVEREITLGSGSAGHLHTRLLPLLRDAAEARLAARHAVDLERRPAAAADLLGPRVWELVRPDRPEPTDRNAPGLALAEVRHAVETLEGL